MSCFADRDGGDVEVRVNLPYPYRDLEEAVPLTGDFVKMLQMRATVTREVLDMRDLIPIQEEFDRVFENREEAEPIEDAEIASHSLFAWELEGGGWARNVESANFSTCQVAELLPAPQSAHPGPPVSLHLYVTDPDEFDGMTGWLQCRAEEEDGGGRGLLQDHYTGLQELKQEFLRLLRSRAALD